MHERWWVVGIVNAGKSFILRCETLACICKANGREQEEDKLGGTARGRSRFSSVDAVVSWVSEGETMSNEVGCVGCEGSKENAGEEGATWPVSECKAKRVEPLRCSIWAPQKVAHSALHWKRVEPPSRLMLFHR